MGEGRLGSGLRRPFPKPWSSVGTGVGQGLWRELGLVSGLQRGQPINVPARSSGRCTIPLNLICGTESVMLAAFGILWGLKEPLCAKPRLSSSHRLGLPPWALGSHLPSEFCLSAIGGGGVLHDGKAAVADTALWPPTSTLPPPSVQNSDLWDKDISLPPHSAREPTRGRHSDTKGGPAQLSGSPLSWVCPLPPTWKEGVKEGAPAILCDHEAAMSVEALC